MDAFAKVIGVAFLAASSVFLLVMSGTLIGALAGWVVGLFFSDTILGILAQLGVKNCAMWQFGAFMGFVGGFLRVSVSKSDD